METTNKLNYSEVMEITDKVLKRKPWDTAEHCNIIHGTILSKVFGEVLDDISIEDFDRIEQAVNKKILESLGITHQTKEEALASEQRIMEYWGWGDNVKNIFNGKPYSDKDGFGSIISRYRADFPFKSVRAENAFVRSQTRNLIHHWYFMLKECLPEKFE
ncbi:hypothetical protein [Lactococcus allomyrinae]|uniref:Uncharacterized protein n=1 Tax=Lactococcus allomyrinae TaxID=2419773 RepID=A0A387B7Y7_9LACT|nr:hypothetical protein [Lactococcus allomyrinae]AYF99802.1 hypothetical protein D7I46_01105 [Lactococcus allomyrinae]